MRTRTLVSALMIAFVGFGVISCATVALEAGRKAWEDRSTEDQITDGKILAGILLRLAEKDKGLLLDVGVDVWEQRVMLTGMLHDPKVRRDVVVIVRRDKRIKALYDEVFMVSKAEKEKHRKEQEKGREKKEGGVGRMIDDFWIAAKIEAKLLAAKKVTSVNYRWRSVSSKAYIIGRAADKAEKKRVLNIIQWTKGVKSVKEFIDIQ